MLRGRAVVVRARLRRVRRCIFDVGKGDSEGGGRKGGCLSEMKERRPDPGNEERMKGSAWLGGEASSRGESKGETGSEEGGTGER